MELTGVKLFQEYYINNYLLLNVQFGSLLGPRGLLLITCGEKTLFKKMRKPRNPSPRLLGLACKAPASHLWCSTTLLFDLLGNHCCRNKPTDALVSQT